MSINNTKTDKFLDLKLLGLYLAILISISLVMWLFGIGSFSEKYNESEPNKIERTIDVLDTAWENWLNDHENNN